MHLEAFDWKITEGPSLVQINLMHLQYYLDSLCSNCCFITEAGSGAGGPSGGTPQQVIFYERDPCSDLGGASNGSRRGHVLLSLKVSWDDLLSP